MYKYIILIAVLIIIIIIIILLIFFNQNDQYKLNLSDNHGYAHFSKKNKYHDFKYVFDLYPGNCLYIPKGFWHKVESFGKCISINFWNDSDIFKYPRITNEIISWDILKKWDYNYLKNKMPEKIWVWNQNNNKAYITTYEEFNKKELKGHYLITLPVYEELNNYLLLHNLIDDFPKLGEQCNIWICKNDVITELHYDDYDGILCMVKGRKKVTLYPPSTPNIEKNNLIPDWINNSKKFKYNIYKKIDNNILIPSSRLFYESLKIGKAKRKIYDFIKENINKYGINKIIWGIKNDFKTKIIRWEIYFYRVNEERENKETIHSLSKNFSPNKLFNLNVDDKNILISSIDLYKDNIDDDIHFYYSKNEIIGYPYEGYTKTLKNKKIVDEADFIIDTQKNIILNLEKYNKQLNLNLKDTDIEKYKAEDIALYQKFEKIGIQYFGISQENFISFLHEFNWSSKFIKYYLENYKEYKNMNHEITINYKIENNNLVPSHTSIYGIL